MKRLKKVLALILIAMMVFSGTITDASMLAVYAAGEDVQVEKSTEEQSQDESQPEQPSDDQEKEDTKEDDKKKSEDNKQREKTPEEESKGGSSAEKTPKEADDTSKDTEKTEEDRLETRDIKAKIVKEDLYKDKKEEKKTYEYYKLSNFWTALTGRKAESEGKELNLEVTVSGKLPEGVKAEAGYILLDDGETHTEKGLFSLDVTLLDKDGNVYIPEEPVEITVRGESLKQEISDDNALIAYSYEEALQRAEDYSKKYDKDIYAADASVYRSESVDKTVLSYKVYDKDKKYKDGEDAVRFTNNKNGLEQEKNSITFEYDYLKKAKSAENQDPVGTISLVVTSQMASRTLTVKSGENLIIVTGHFAKPVTLQAAEITEKNKDYKEYIEKTADALDAEVEDLAIARAFDISLIDPETKKEFEPDSEVKVSIKLADEEINKDSNLSVVHFEDGKDKNTEIMDVTANGDTIKFTTDGFSVFVVTSTLKPNSDGNEGESEANSEPGEDQPHNPKIIDFSAGEYDPETGTITYSVKVTADGDMDYTTTTQPEEGEPVTEGKEYPVNINGLNPTGSSSFEFVSGKYTYTHKPEFTPSEESKVENNEVTEGETHFSGFPLTVDHMYDGDTITVTYVAKVTGGEYDNQHVKVTNSATITNGENPYNIIEDDSSDPIETTFYYEILERKWTKLEGSWASWEVTVNPNALTINGSENYTLEDTFDDGDETHARQSIDYHSILVSSDSVSYDYSGNTGKYNIPDGTSVTITYRTRITANAGENVTYQGTAQLKNGDGEIIASKTAGDENKVYPSASDVAGFGTNYMVKMYVYAEGQMQTGVPGTKFILLDADERPMEYKVGENKGKPVTFTTGEDGYVDVELHEEDGDVTIEKNTVYYLEMIKAPSGYQKDNTLYSFMITDNPLYSAGDGVYTYYNGDTMKVRLYKATPGVRVTIRSSGNYELTTEQQDNVTAILQKLVANETTHEYEWIEVERHANADAQWGAISFTTELDADTTYRVIQENVRPWDVPEETVKIKSTYYCVIGEEEATPNEDPVEFIPTQEDIQNGITVVIDNRYEEPQMTITKMNKKTGETLAGAEFTVKKAKDDTPVKTYTTQEDGLVDIRGGADFESETLYYVEETKAPSKYLLPLTPEKHYFYFCNDEYLIPSILADLPEGETAVNLSESSVSFSIDNQEEEQTIPVMKTWQGNSWPVNIDRVVVGLYKSVKKGDPEPVMVGDNPLCVSLSVRAPYNNTMFTHQPSRDNDGNSITYSIKEEHVYTTDDIDVIGDYVQEYGISDAGVYVVRNREATSLTVNKNWFNDDDFTQKVSDSGTLNEQSDVTFDVYQSTEKIPDDIRTDGITNEEMTQFVSTLTKVRENLTFGKDDNWTKTLSDLPKKDDNNTPYYYYVLETVPSFGDEKYEVDEENGTVMIKNKVAPDTVSITVTKAHLVDDPREESKYRKFKFTLALKKGNHPIREYTVANGKKTDWNGEVIFELQPEDSQQLTLPVGVTATVTEDYNPEYTVKTESELTDLDPDNKRVFKYSVTEETNDKEIQYVNTLRVICKVVVPSGVDPKPFESLNSALTYIRENPGTAYIGGVATIQMLENYTIPETDIFAVRDDENIYLTTAPVTDPGDGFPFKPESEGQEIAVITRGGNNGSMLTNAGTLTLDKVALNGNKNEFTVEVDGGLINSTGTLNLRSDTTLCNSSVIGKGGAIYATGTVNMPGGIITGNSATSGSAIYLDGDESNLEMTSGSITGNTGASDGAVVVNSLENGVNVSGDPVIYENTNNKNEAANLYIDADSDKTVNVKVPGLSESAHIGITAMTGHREIGEQFASVAYEVEDKTTLSRFSNDTYGYRGKLKDGSGTNVIWDGLSLTINKNVTGAGANLNDTFKITLSSRAIKKSSYMISGTMDYVVNPARNNRPGTIEFTNVHNSQEITISPLPVGDYTITEEQSDYSPTYESENEETHTPVTINDEGVFTLDGDSSITVTNTRRQAKVKLKKSLNDKLVGESAVQFPFTVELKNSDNTPIVGYTIYSDKDHPENNIITDENGVATVNLSLKHTESIEKMFDAPVGAAMKIIEDADTGANYRKTISARTNPEEETGTEIINEDTEDDNIFAFHVTDDGAYVQFANVRKMAEIELRKDLIGKVSNEESTSEKNNFNQFTITVTLKSANGRAAANYVMNDDPDNPIKTNEKGVAVIQFDFANTVETSKSVHLSIPEGTNLKFDETDIKKSINGTDQSIYDTTYSVNGGAAKSGKSHTFNPVAESDNSIVFTNTRKTRQITVKNTVNGYSGNIVPFTFTATVAEYDGDASVYAENGFVEGSQTFELTAGQSKVLTVPYGVDLKIRETYIVGYETTIKHGNTQLENLVDPLMDEFVVSANVTVTFTNNQLIGLRLVNNTSSNLQNVKIDVEKNKIYRVYDDETGQELISEDSEALINIEKGKTVILEIEHETSVSAEQSYVVTGLTPKDNYYYTINNEPSFHEYADPAVQRIYNVGNYNLKGKLRYSVNDSTITFTEQPLVSFDVRGGTWTADVEGYNDKDGKGQVYQIAVDYDDKVEEPEEPVYPTSEGIIFLGWTEDKTFAEANHTKEDDVSEYLYNFDDQVTKPVDLYAIWAKKNRDKRIVTISNQRTATLNVIATLTLDGEAVSDYPVIDDDNKTNAEGQIVFSLPARKFKNLAMPDGAKLVLDVGIETLAVSSEFEIENSADRKIFTINSVDRDGTVSFIQGVCKITDEDGNLLYQSNGQPTVYGSLSEAFNAYKWPLFKEVSHTTEATRAAIKMLVDECEIDINTITIPDYTNSPNKNVTLTTAGKNDSDFPFIGSQDRATLYRESFTRGSLFKFDLAANLTLTNIILDGKNVEVSAVNGGLINLDKANSTLTIDSGTTMRNVVFSNYANNCNGGAIYMTYGTLNVKAGLFSNLHGRQGGAIYVNGGTLNVSGTEGNTRFENCCTESASDGDGGAIYYNKKQNLEINGGTDKNNPGIIFDSCVARGSTGSGGAIYVATSSSEPVSVSGCSFIECSARTTEAVNAANGGGAICANGVGNPNDTTSLSVNACTFNACDTQSRGGAIVVWVQNSKTVEINDSSFDQCNARGQGGAIAVYQQNQESGSAGESVKKTKLVTTGCDFSNCSSGTQNGSGGAIQCYVPCMEFTDSNFTDCWAGKEGGAVNNYFANGYTAVWTESYMTMDNCTFIRCRAEDRFDPTALQHYGGGVNTKVYTATVTDSYFKDCVSTLKEGGALHLGGQSGGSKATITGSKFINCSAKNGGGAVLSSHETLEIANSFFYGCSSSASNGGAVYHTRNSRGDSVQNQTTIENSEFSAEPESGDDSGSDSEGDDESDSETRSSCSAAGNGGAVWTRAKNVKVEGCTIDGCIANGNGGGIYQSCLSSSDALYKGGSIEKCEASQGSAVYVGNKAKATFDDITITDNNVNTINNAAVEGGNSESRLYFQGKSIVENNTCSADSEHMHDVLMQIDGVAIINTAVTSLDREAHIGVYVPDIVFEKRGTESKAFGTYQSDDYLGNFFNDRNDGLFGFQLSETDNKIYWGYYLCKITDENGNTLKRTNGKDAVYQSLTNAIKEFTLVTDDSGGKTAKFIKMLVEKYPLQSNDTITNFPDGDITITTAGSDDQQYPYAGSSGTVCTIFRNSKQSTASNQLFKLSNSKTTLRFEDITLDGRKDLTSTDGHGHYRLIEADFGNVVISNGATLQYGYSSAKSSGGGAVYISTTSATLEINSTKEKPVLFDHCMADIGNDCNGGAIYSMNTVTVSGDEDTHSTSFVSCNAKRGGAIAVGFDKNDTSTVKTDISVNGAEFINCSSFNGGGAICHNNAYGESEAIIENSSFKSCHAEGSTEWSFGGAVDSKAGKCTVSSCVFDDCYAQLNGGAINHCSQKKENIETIIIDTDFKNCRTTDTDTNNNYGFGGSVYTRAKTVSITRGSFENSVSYNYGGALYCLSNNAETSTTISGTSFDHCSVLRTEGYGGAIYSRGKTLVLQNDVNGKGARINACTASGYSGAVHMETAISKLTVKGNTVISGCYARYGGVIYLIKDVTMDIIDGPEFTQNGYFTSGESIINAEKGACIYLVEDSRLNLSGSPKFSRNIITDKPRVVNGGVTDYVRQDVFLAGYVDDDENANSIHIAGELTGDIIWIWPEQIQSRVLPGKQFATTETEVSKYSLEKLRNARDDNDTTCNNGEFLAGIRNPGSPDTKVYWDKMYNVQFNKKDNKAVTVPGAEFTIYDDIDCTLNPITAVSADGETDTDAQGNLRERGVVDFTSISIGTYFMKETRVPESFEENNTKYIVLVGSPALQPTEYTRDIWYDGGPLDIQDAATLVYRSTIGIGKYYGIFPLKDDGKADLSKNLASANAGVINIRTDYAAYFMKVDSADDSLPGAAFTIYTEEGVLPNGYPKLKLWSRDGENYPEPVKSADGTSDYKYPDGTIIPKGLVYFRELPIGTYYLLETEYPERNGDNRRTFYVETDRVLELEVKGTDNFTLKELQDEGGEYRDCEKTTDNKYYKVSNKEAVCKVTDNEDNLLYEIGRDGETQYPAIYHTLQEGFNAVQNNNFYDGSKKEAVIDESTDSAALKLKALTDFTLKDSITYDKNSRDITFTTAEKTASKDKYVFVTNRTTDTSRADIHRGYDEDTVENANKGALINIKNSKMTLQNISLNGDKEHHNGRALHVTGGSSLTLLNNTRLHEFKQEADADSTDENDIRGGAVLLDDDTTLTVDGGSSRSVVFLNNEVVNHRTTGSTGSDGGALAMSNNCTVSLSNVQFTNNKAQTAAENKGNGGAVCATRDFTVTNGVFTGNTASNNGGALFAKDGVNIIFNGGSLSGNTAKLGSAVFVSDEAQVTVTNSIISGNNASTNEGGAINVGGSNSKVYFSGSPVVFDNVRASDDSVQRNVVLDHDSNEVINTTGNGLRGGLIGVYVIDGEDYFDKHGIYNKPFGYYENESSGEKGKNVDAFINDRALSLRGEKREAGLIYWPNVVCKLTDNSNNLLYQKQQVRVGSLKYTFYAPAVCKTIKGGFDAVDDTLYYKSGKSYKEYKNEIKFKVMQDYELNEKEIINYETARNLTITTAENTLSPSMREKDDYYVFTPTEGATGDRLTKATLTRKQNQSPMITVNSKNKQIAVTDVILDGNKNDYSELDIDGGIVKVKKGKFAIESGAVLQNSSAKKGGAVYVASGGTVTMTGGTVNDNESTDDGAGIYLAKGAVMKISGKPNFGGTGLDADGNILNTSGNGNFKLGELNNKKNGGKTYTKARQDIYIAGYASNNDEDTSAASLIVTGNITSGNGTIWVWAAESPHYKRLCQFAKYENGVTDKETTFAAFRNARPDDYTGADREGKYLYGITKSGDTGKNVYWFGIEGFRKVILRKVDGNFDSVENKTFTIMRDGAVVKVKVNDVEKELKDLHSRESGVIWIGELPLGTYDIVESDPERTFTIEIKEDGIYDKSENKTHEISWK